MTEFPESALSSRIPSSFDEVVSKYSNPNSNAAKLQHFITHKAKSVLMENMNNEDIAQELVVIAQCTQAKHANILFHVPPMHPKISLSSDDWNQMVRAHLALLNFPTSAPKPHARFLLIPIVIITSIHV